MSKTKKQKERYYFFLNPYPDEAFTRCPKCETKTKIRKYCLVIHIEPNQLISLNKTCRFCPYCELIIVKKEELEENLYVFCEEMSPEIIGNDYFVFGTMDRKDWKKGQEGPVYLKEASGGIYIFKEVWNFEVIPGGWYYPADNKK